MKFNNFLQCMRPPCKCILSALSMNEQGSKSIRKQIFKRLTFKSKSIKILFSLRIITLTFYVHLDILDMHSFFLLSYIAAK